MRTRQSRRSILRFSTRYAILADAVGGNCLRRSSETRGPRFHGGSAATAAQADRQGYDDEAPIDVTE